MNKVFTEAPSTCCMKKVNISEKYFFKLLTKEQGCAAVVRKCIEKRSGDVNAVKIIRTDDEEKMNAAKEEFEL